jgi:hypothetical protein
MVEQAIIAKPSTRAPFFNHESFLQTPLSFLITVIVSVFQAHIGAKPRQAARLYERNNQNCFGKN